jgi:4-hydroxy-tetrahydrodipicolinate synthase
MGIFNVSWYLEDSLMDRYRGIFTPICTPFSGGDHAIDEKALCGLVEFQVSNGVHGIITCAGTGQFSALSVAERKQVTEIAVAQTRNRVPVVAHTGACGTAESIDEIVAHFKSISRAAPLPIMVYNNPYASKINIGPELLRRLCAIKNIVSLKEGAGDLVQFQRIVMEFGDRLVIFNGWDTGAFATLMQGADGCAWGAANATPRECVELYKLIVEKRDIAKARALWDRLFPLNLFFESEGYASSIKAATTLAGVDLGVNRAPLNGPSEAKIEELKQLLRNLD